MTIEFAPHFEEEFAKYKKVYQKFMGYTDEQMPSDQTLLFVAIGNDMAIMETEMKKWKN